MDSLKENGELSHSSERSFLKTQDKRWSWVVCPVSKQVYEIWEAGALQELFWLDACGRGGWGELLGLCLKQDGEGMLPTQQVTGHRAQGGVNLMTLLCSFSVSCLRERKVQMELDKGHWNPGVLPPDPSLRLTATEEGVETALVNKLI